MQLNKRTLSLQSSLHVMLSYVKVKDGFSSYGLKLFSRPFHTIKYLGGFFFHTQEFFQRVYIKKKYHRYYDISLSEQMFLRFQLLCG